MKPKHKQKIKEVIDHIQTNPEIWDQRYIVNIEDNSYCFAALIAMHEGHKIEKSISRFGFTSIFKNGIKVDPVDLLGEIARSVGFSLKEEIYYFASSRTLDEIMELLIEPGDNNNVPF